jgi:hypothetical protein
MNKLGLISTLIVLLYAFQLLNEFWYHLTPHHLTRAYRLRVTYPRSTPKLDVRNNSSMFQHSQTTSALFDISLGDRPKPGVTPSKSGESPIRGCAIGNTGDRR